jgi:hypothetical protein
MERAQEHNLFISWEFSILPTELFLTQFQVPARQYILNQLCSEISPVPPFLLMGSAE